MTLYITFSVVFKFYVTSIRVGGNRECCGNDEPHIVSTNSPPHKPVLSAKSMNSLSLSRDPKLEHQFVQKIVNRAGVCPQEDGRAPCHTQVPISNSTMPHSLSRPGNPQIAMGLH